MEAGRFRALPAVHRLLLADEAKRWVGVYCRSDVLAALRQSLAQLREQIGQGSAVDTSERAILATADALLREGARRKLRSLINATGTVLHTNLGRAPLADEAIEAMIDVAKGYSNLEFSLATGERGQRADHVEDLLCELTGAEAATVVNNNAAAVYLVLHELAARKKVVISRGELVEIGGSFRVSDVMSASGAELIEVGTTNRTHVSDYASALEAGAELLLRVHHSNFRIVGFSSRPPLADLVMIARRYGVPVIEDLGSGSLVDLRAKGIGDEPTIQESLQAGVDIVTFSGDKLLGATQAGIICGRKVLIDRIRKNPLARAVRIDKLTLAALEATLRLYRREEDTLSRIPTLALLTRPAKDIAKDAERLAEELAHDLEGLCVCRVIETQAQVGGGALPCEQILSYAIGLSPVETSASRLTTALLELEMPIVARVVKEEVIMDVRTVFPWQYDALKRGVRTAVKRSAQANSSNHFDG